MVSRYGFALLAPHGAAFKHRTGGAFCADAHLYKALLSSMQMLRGRTYLEDGAITLGEIDASGRFRLEDDEACWHILLTEGGHDVIGCLRVRIFSTEVSFQSMRVRYSALAADPVFGPKVRAAINADLEVARQQGLRYAEIGGWALAHRWRGTKAALDILAASYALGELVGGCLGVAMATFRHDSASILKRIGATPFVVDGEELPPYQDPRYGCTMQLLRFTRTPVQRYALLIDPLRKALEQTTVIMSGRAATLPRPAPAIFQPDVELVGEVA